MRFLVDENIARTVVDELRARGHDVAWIAELAAGIDDGEVLRTAWEQQRVVLTHDKDYGRRALQEPSGGVIIVRATIARPTLDAILLCDVLDSRTDWDGHLSVVDHRRVRMRALPNR